MKPLTVTDILIAESGRYLEELVVKGFFRKPVWSFDMSWADKVADCRCRFAYRRRGLRHQLDKWDDLLAAYEP